MKLKNFYSGEIIFTTVFYSVLIALPLIFNVNVLLLSFKGRMIGEATLMNTDVQMRIWKFYIMIIVFAGLNILFQWLYSKLKNFFLTDEKEILNVSSLAGLILLALSFFNENFTAVMKQTLSITEIALYLYPILLIIILHAMIYARLILNRIVLKKTNEAFISHHYSFILVISFSLVFFLQTIFQMFSLANIPSLVILSSICSFIVFMFLTFYLKNERADFQQSRLEKICWTCTPLIFFPLVRVIGEEFFLILFNHHIQTIDIKFFVLGGFILLILLSLFLFSFSKRKISVEKYLFSVFFPFLVINIISFRFYEHSFTGISEAFETANHVLPLQQLVDFGKIPILESGNAHLLHDFALPFVHTIFNGLNLDIYSYDFLILVVVYISAYFLFLRLTKNGFASLFITLLFPFTRLLIVSPELILGLGVALIVPVLLCRLSHKPSLLNHFLFFSSCAFFIFWRMDIGCANTIACILTIAILYSFDSSFFLNLKYSLRYILIISASIVLTVSFFVIWRNIPLLKNLNLLVAYFSSAQSYGFSDLAIYYNELFYIHYFIFPLLAIILLFYLIKKLKNNYAISSPQKHNYGVIILIYLIFFYLANFQRGLIRHSLIEKFDVPMSSFIYLILAGSVYIIFRQSLSELNRFIVFIAVSVLLTYSFKVPKEDVVLSEAAFTGVIQKLVKQDVHINLSQYAKNIDIIRNNEFTELKNFLDEHLAKDETFMDFSNSPMLYFYTRRMLPGYLIQCPNMLHNDYLQNEHLKELGEFKIPVCILSHVPERWEDNADNVPNAVRHYRIAEYIFNHYKPAYLINNYNVWIKNELYESFMNSKLNDRYLRSESSDSVQTYLLLYLPYVWGNRDKNFLNGNIQILIALSNKTEWVAANNETKYSFNENMDKQTGNYIQLNLKNMTNADAKIELAYGDDEKINGLFIFNIVPDNQPKNYLVRISTQYNWYSHKNNWLSIKPLNGDVEINFVKILKGD